MFKKFFEMMIFNYEKEKKKVKKNDEFKIFKKINK